MDIDTLIPGQDWAREIEEAVSNSDVLIALIGEQWVDAKDTAGNRRIDNPGDFLRREIVTAINLGIPIIPVLVGGAEMPQPSEMPDDLVQLTDYHAIEISNRFHTDVSRLIGAIRNLLL
jgi:hypothetical protein